MKTLDTSIAVQTPAACPFHSSPFKPSPAFSVIDALNGFVRLGKRTETLSGSIPVRSVACKPFVDGNKSGLHVWFREPVLLSRDEANPAIQMTDELFNRVHRGYEALIGELIARGLLIENGYWHQRLSAGPVLRRNGVVSVWTGLLVKPAHGLWLLSTGGYNRRPRVNMRECAIASSEGYTPLILEFELDSMFKDTMWLEAELACLVPVQPGVSFTRSTIRERPELGVAYNSFYNDSYLETRGGARTVGVYRKMMAQSESSAESSGARGEAKCELVHIAGPDVHTIETFNHVVGPQGPSTPETAAELKFAVLRNFTTLEFDFDGMQSHLNNEDANPFADELLSTWRELYGEQTPSPVQWWTMYFIPNLPEMVGEMVQLIVPYAFIKTPPGWSTLCDGAHYPGLDGLRGVIATDLFHHTPPAYQYRQTGDFRLEYGDPLMRLLPVPRHLLDAPYEMLELSSMAG